MHSGASRSSRKLSIDICCCLGGHLHSLGGVAFKDHAPGVLGGFFVLGGVFWALWAFWEFWVLWAAVARCRELADENLHIHMIICMCVHARTRWPMSTGLCICSYAHTPRAASERA